MNTEKEVLLSAVISREVQREMAVYCVTNGIKIKCFVEKALRDALKRKKG